MFSAIRDRQIIEAGGFWCSACCVGKPAPEASPDPRYCQPCYDFLLKEAEILGNGKHPKWVPVTAQEPSRKTVERTTGRNKTAVGERGHTGILSTVNEQKIEVDKIKPRTTNRGRKKIDLPMDIINKLAERGMRSKAIAGTLLTEYGLAFNYRTIARVLEKY